MDAVLARSARQPNILSAASLNSVVRRKNMVSAKTRDLPEMETSGREELLATPPARAPLQPLTHPCAGSHRLLAPGSPLPPPRAVPARRRWRRRAERSSSSRRPLAPLQPPAHPRAGSRRLLAPFPHRGRRCRLLAPSPRHRGRRKPDLLVRPATQKMREERRRRRRRRRGRGRRRRRVAA
jgi:hypothetical protein